MGMDFKPGDRVTYEGAVGTVTTAAEGWVAVDFGDGRALACHSSILDLTVASAIEHRAADQVRREQTDALAALLMQPDPLRAIAEKVTEALAYRNTDHDDHMAREIGRRHMPEQWPISGMEHRTHVGTVRDVKIYTDPDGCACPMPADKQVVQGINDHIDRYKQDFDRRADPYMLITEDDHRRWQFEVSAATAYRLAVTLKRPTSGSCPDCKGTGVYIGFAYTHETCRTCGGK